MVLPPNGLSGARVRAYYRTGTTMPWTFVGEDDINFDNVSLLAGLAVTSHVDGRVAAGTFDHVTVSKFCGRKPA
jgi:hypothetical protein